MRFSEDVERGLLNTPAKKASYLYGAVENHGADDGDQHTASCSSCSSSTTSKNHGVKSMGVDSESSPLIILLPPDDQQSIISDDSSSQDGSASDNGSQGQSSRICRTYHECDVTGFTTEHTEWTVSEGTVTSLDEEEKSNCCSFRSCGRGIRVPGWEAYNKSLDTNPVLTKACTSLSGWFLGDFFTQTVITRGGAFDFQRSITLASFGFFFHGPMGHVVYDNLDQIIVGTGPKQIAAKIFVDQVLWCPIFMVCYFTYLGLANGDAVATILEKLHNDLFIAILGSWKLWPVAHAIQFRYVATKHRIVYINCIEVCFIMFLSFLGNQ